MVPTAAAALAKMYRGERMTVLEKGDTWSKVQYKGQMGYAMSQYLRFYEEEAWCGEAVEGLAAVVNADALALYDEASTTAAAIMTVGRGEHVTVLMQDAAWSQVVYGGRTGYVPNSSLAFYAVVQPGDVLEPVTTATVDAGSLWLRTSGEGTAPTIASMPRGQVVDVLEKGGSWSKVVFDGMVGYSMNEFLIFADEGPRGAAGAYHYRDGQCRFPVAARVWFHYRAHQGKDVPRRQGGCAGEGRNLVQGRL